MVGNTNRRVLGIGRVNFGRAKEFRHDGKRHAALEGDTVTSALLANGVWLTGRSFKYHRPRGPFAADEMESNSLYEIHEGGEIEPNVPSPLVRNRLETRSQNRYPSLQYDLLAVNSRLSRFLSAGFYYKTFIGPRKKSWMFYEPFIRRAAGLGRVQLGAAATPATMEQNETSHIFAEVFVIGGGVAGLAAALTAATAGVRVVLAEQDGLLGGSLLWERGGSESELWRQRVVAALERAPNVRILRNTVCFGAYDGNCFGLVEELPPREKSEADPLLASLPQTQEQTDPDRPESSLTRRFYIVRAEKVVLTTGASERPLVFSGNDLPGVVLASAARAWLHRWAVLAGKRILVAGNNDAAWETARDLARAGSNVGARVVLADARTSGVPPALMQEVQGAGVLVHSGRVPLRAEGKKALRKVVLAKWDSDSHAVRVGRGDDGVLTVAADMLCLSGGWSPKVHLLSQRGVRPRWDGARVAFVPPNDLPNGWHIAGGAAGDFARDACVDGGAAAGFAAVSSLSPESQQGGQNAVAETAATLLITPEEAEAALSYDQGGALARCGLRGETLPIWRIARAGESPSKAFVDLAGDVTVADIEQACDEGFVAPEHMKRYTTAGMGSDQGKYGNVNALGVLALALGSASESSDSAGELLESDLNASFDPDPDLGKIGTTTFRPPYRPVNIGALAGGHAGRHFHPVRRTALHESHLREGVNWLETGLWLRPRYYPTDREETVTQGYTREAAEVRRSVGLFDISTLGKILVQGSGATELLERIYVNNWASLKVGKVRYGVMLRDDGMVADDGTTARVSENEYFMTTTTANAGEVLARMEFLLQTAWQDLDVHLTSITDDWAGIAVAGPQSRDLLEAIFPDEDLSNENLPYMGAYEFEYGGRAARIHRVSFTGERSYEVFVAAGLGNALWSRLREGYSTINDEGEESRVIPLPFGLEAQDTMRQEKGHIAGGELDGRTTLTDLGLNAMAEKKRGTPATGVVLSKRAGLTDPSRPRLVGLRPERETDRVVAGSLLYGADGALTGHGEGWISSACVSPQMNGSIGLGFLRGGLAREGEIICAADPTGVGVVRLRVVSAHFFDPEGERLRG